jgi:hypothetical protein
MTLYYPFMYLEVLTGTTRSLFQNIQYPDGGLNVEPPGDDVEPPGDEAEMRGGYSGASRTEVSDAGTGLAGQGDDLLVVLCIIFIVPVVYHSGYAIF